MVRVVKPNGIQVLINAELLVSTEPSQNLFYTRNWFNFFTLFLGKK